MSKTLKASVLIGGSISSSLRSALGSTKDGLKQIGQAITDVNRKQKALGQTIKDFSHLRVKNMDQLKAQYAALGREADRLRAAQARLLTTQRALDANNERRQKLGGQMMGAVGAAVATGFAIGRPVMNAANFARENQLIGNTANMSRQEVAALGQTIIRESRVTNQGANELQKAIGFLVAAGLDVKTAEASIRTIGRTTTAAGADIEDLSKASFTLIDALKIKPEGLQGALDMLAVAGKEGNVELKDMAKVLPVLGSSFVALKMGGAEAVATMGAALEIARKGAADADSAANNMQNFMVKMMSPETLKKAKKNFGIDLYKIITDAQTKGANPFEAAMQSIMKATGGDQKKIGDLFQDMQVQAFLRPMIQNWDEYTRIKNKALKESAGTTDRDFALMMEQDAEKMKAAKIAADNLAKTYGAALAPTIGDAAGKLALFMDKASEFIQKHPGFVVGATKLVAGVVGLRVAVLGLGYAWTFIKAPILQVAAAIARFQAGGLVASLGRAAPIALRVASAFRWIATAAAAIGGGPVAIAIGVLVAGALLVRKYWEPIKAFLAGLWDGFSSGVRPAIDSVIAAFAPMLPIWREVGSNIGKVWDWFVKLIDPITASEEGLSRAAQVGRVFGMILARSATTVITLIGGMVKATVWLAQQVYAASTFINNAMSSAWDGVKNAAGAALDWIMVKLKPVTDAIGWVVDKVASVGGAAIDMLIGSKNAGAPVPAAAGMTPPSVPAVAGARGASGAPMQQHNTYHIQQLPGENAEDLARRITAQQRREQEAKQRARLSD